MLVAALTLGFLALCVWLMKYLARDVWRQAAVCDDLPLEAELYSQTASASEHERIDNPALEDIRWTALDDHQLTRVLRESAK